MNVSTEFPWLERVPDTWALVRLKTTIDSCQNGLWGDEPDGNNDIICVRVADFHRPSRRVLLEEPTLRALPLSKVANRLLRTGDLLIEKSGGGEQQPVGTVVIYDHGHRAICSNFVARMQTARPNSSRYLCYVHQCLYGLGVPTRSIKQTTGIQNLDTESYFNERIALPSEGEQRSLASFLDRKTAAIDTLVAKKERMIDLLQEKRQALITQAVTKGLDPSVPMKESGVEWLGRIPASWEVAPLKHAVSRIVDCPHATPEYEEDGPSAVVRTADVDRGRLLVSQMRRCSLATHRERSLRMELSANDVVYSREGERFGMSALVPPDLRTCLGQRMMAFRAAPQTSPAFLMWSLNSTGVYCQVLRETAGATSPHVNVSTVANLVLAFPPRAEQDAIAGIIDQSTASYDFQAARILRSVELLREYRQSLITAAVTGKLDIPVEE